MCADDSGDSDSRDDINPKWCRWFDVGGKRIGLKADGNREIFGCLERRGADDGNGISFIKCADLAIFFCSALGSGVADSALIEGRCDRRIEMNASTHGTKRLLPSGTVDVPEKLLAAVLSDGDVAHRVDNDIRVRAVDVAARASDSDNGIIV
ncbi:hypothetical protein D3C86_1487210 [compost metagenome]